MEILRKYAAATHVYIPMIKHSVIDFAVGADWTPAAGDVKVSKDGGAAANIGTLPTAIAMGNTAYWDFTLTGTELTAALVVVTVADSATKAVEDQAFVIATYGDASAQHAIDLDDSVRAGLTALPNAAAGANGGLPTGNASGQVAVGSIVANAIASGVIASAALNEIADALLKRDFSSVTGEASRSMLNALRLLRNKITIAAGTLSVKKENDSTEAWNAAVTTTAGNPISTIDPS